MKSFVLSAGDSPGLGLLTLLFGSTTFYLGHTLSVVQINLQGETLRCRWQRNLPFVVVVTNLHACLRSLSSLLFTSDISRVVECQQNSLSLGKILAFFSPLLASLLVLAQEACQYNLHRYLIFPHWLSSLSRSLQPFSLFLINILTPRKALTGLCVFLFRSHSFWARFRRSKNLCNCHLNISRLIQLPCLSCSG